MADIADLAAIREARKKIESLVPPIPGQQLSPSDIVWRAMVDILIQIDLRALRQEMRIESLLEMIKDLEARLR